MKDLFRLLIITIIVVLALFIYRVAHLLSPFEFLPQQDEKPKTWQPIDHNLNYPTDFEEKG